MVLIRSVLLTAFWLVVAGAMPALLAELEAEQPLSANYGTDSLIGYINSIPSETAGDQKARHQKIAERRSRPIVIVHRGASAFAPENTLEAYAAAMDHGADGCEVDLRRTADGVLVLFHDEGLERMTDALGRIDQYNYAELLAFRFRSLYGANAGSDGIGAFPGADVPDR